MVRHDAAREIGLFAANWRVVVVQLQAELPQVVDLGVANLNLVGFGLSGGREQHADAGRTEVSQRMTRPLPHRSVSGQDQSSSL